MDCRFEGLLTEKQVHHGTAMEFTEGGQYVARVTIDKLPDVALLEIFDFYLDGLRTDPSPWHRLVHVCRKWRNVIFGSPRRLGLKLFCHARTPVRKTLDVWPPLPIIIRAIQEKWGDDGIIAAFEHNDRMCEIDVTFGSSSQSKNFLEALHQPFPALKRLRLVCYGDEMDETLPVLPDSVLCGSAQSLETLSLHHIPFPGLPKLLLSATHLVNLHLYNIPHSGYISPEVLVTPLSLLTRLEFFHIGFESPQSRPDRRRPPPQTRTPLPILSSLHFQGVSEYLEDLVARIDVPLLNDLNITFLHQLIFDIPQLNQFINRTSDFTEYDKAYVQFDNRLVSMELRPEFVEELDLELSILCSQSDWQLSSLAQLCSSSFPQDLISAVERLDVIDEARSQLRWQDDIESVQWLELLQPFTGVKDFYISRDFVPRIAPALQELVEERMTEVLFPSLKTLFLQEAHLSGSHAAIEHFVAERQLAGHPIAVSRW